MPHSLTSSDSLAYDPVALAFQIGLSIFTRFARLGRGIGYQDDVVRFGLNKLVSGQNGSTQTINIGFGTGV